MPNEPDPKTGSPTAGTTEPKQGYGIDPKIAELMKDPDAIAELLKTKRSANAEAKTYREKLEALEKKRQDDEKKALEDQGKFKDLAEKEKGEKVELAKRFSERAIVNELKTEALKAGIINSDDVALADRSAVKADENFVVTGAAEAIEALKKSKPYLFTAADDRTPMPPPGAPPPKLKDKLFNPNLESESPEARITRGFEASMRKK